MINFSFDFFKPNMRNTYDITSINNIISSKGAYNSDKLYTDLNNLKRIYPFIEVGSIGKSVLKKDIPYIKIGNGKREVFYSASYHANEWITSVLLMKFLSDYCYAYQNNYKIFNYYAQSLYEKTTLYIVPMVNPDGVDLVTGKYAINSPIYNFAKNISLSFPQIPFPSGWKANLRGVDLNLQFPAGWQNAKRIKYSQGFTKPAPKNFVGFKYLTEPESLAIYNFTMSHNFDLIIAYHTQGKEIYWQYQNYAPDNAITVGTKFANISRLYTC